MGNRLFVGNLPFDATETQVRELVEGTGKTVTSVKLVTDKDTGRSRGFAFVDLDSDEAAKAAIAALHGKDFGGRQLNVNEAQERGAGGGGGKFGGGGGFRGTQHGGDREHQKGGFGSRGPGQNNPRGSQRGGGRGGGRGT